MSPIYEYECEEHGKFEALRPMDASGIPALCPVCDRLSGRIISACTYKLNFNQMTKALPDKEAPNDRNFHPEWDS